MTSILSVMNMQYADEAPNRNLLRGNNIYWNAYPLNLHLLTGHFDSKDPPSLKYFVDKCPILGVYNNALSEYCVFIHHSVNVKIKQL